MGKKNSKLKQDTIDRLTTATYCKSFSNFSRVFFRESRDFVVESRERANRQ